MSAVIGFHHLQLSTINELQDKGGDAVVQERSYRRWILGLFARRAEQD